MNHPTPPRRPVFRALATTFALVALVPRSFSQATPTPPTAEPEDVVTLREFQVSAARAASAYLATESTAGTRTGAKLTETPYSVQVLTNEFMNDFQLFEMADQLRYVAGAFSGAEDTGANNGRTLRGFSPPVLRDGFSRANPPNRATVDRVEIIRGPVSTLYGQSSPGGLINYVSKRAKRTPRYSLTATLGDSYGFQRFAADATGPLVKDKLFYYAVYAHDYTDSDLQYFSNQKDLYAAGVTYVLSPRTSLTASWERQVIESNQGDTIPILQVAAPTRSVGIYWDLATYNIMGPHNVLDRDFESGNLLVEHRFAPTLIARLNLQTYDKDFTENQYRYGSGNALLAGGTMTAEAFRQNQDESAHLAQADLLWTGQTGRVKHALLLAADANLYALRNMTFVAPPVRTSPTINRRPTYVINPFAPVWPKIPDADISQVFQDTDREITTTGALASHRMFLLDGRCVTMAGLRYDRVKNRKLSALAATAVVGANNQIPVVTVTDGSGSSEDALSYTLGANYKLRGDSLVWFANHSTGFEPTVSIDTGTQAVVPNETSTGLETGLKGSLFNDELSWTASVFTLKKNDVALSNPAFSTAALPGTPQFILGGQEESKGGEVDARWNVNPSLYVQAGGSFVDANVTDPVDARDRLAKAPRYGGYLATRYVIRTGPWKGLRFGASTSYTSDYLFNRGTATRFRQINPAVVLHNAFVGYTWRAPGKLTHHVALNAQNLFDKFYLQDSFRLARGRELRVTYTVAY
jgi:outer membrane receptor protein involved in Fe transport